MATFIDKTDDGFIFQTVKFCSKVGPYASTLGLDSTKLTAFAKDAALFGYVLTAMGTFRDFAEGYTNYKILLRYGHGSEVLGALPVPPTLPSPAPDVTFANMQKRFADLIGDCTRSSNYTKAIGADLGIEAPDTPFDPAAGKPNLKGKRSPGGLAQLHVTKGHYEGYEVWKDTGTGYVKFDKSNHADYIDHSPLPPLGQTAIVKYKTRYLYHSEAVGEWSDEVSITIYGSV